MQARHRRVYEIEANDRAPQRMAQLGAALAEINGRELLVDGRRLEYRLVGLPDGDQMRRSGSS